MRLFGDHGYPVCGGGSDQGDQIHAVFLTGVVKFSFFLKGKIRENQSVDTDPGAGADELFRVIGKYHIGVGHKDHGNREILSELPYHIKDLVGGDTAGQCS